MLFSSRATQNDKAIVAALNTSLAVIEFTPRGDILTANSNFLACTGYTLSEIQGRHHSLFCEADYSNSEAYRRFWGDLERGIFNSGTYKRVAKGGAALWLQATYNPIRDAHGRVTKVIKFASDITAARLREMDEAGKISAIYRAQAVIEFSPTGEILTANDNFLAAIGYHLDEIKGRHHRMFCEEAYANSEAYRQFWERLGRGEYQSAEYKRLGKGGREIYIQATYNPILDEAGKVVKVVKFATDVTAAVLRRQRNDRANAGLGTVISQIFDAAEKATSASSASEETGAIINSVAAASEELSQSVRDISQSMSFARNSVEGVFKHAESANVSANTLNSSATAMNNVVKLINDIAGQINLLALNATIESARAGEAGRGFAVVASEVKNLAKQASQSTQTIANEISNMQSVTTEVCSALGLISNSMNDVLSNVTSIAGAIEQQNAVTGEITHNMQSAVTAVGQINDSLSNISETFSHVADASQKVKQEMQALVA